MGFSIGVCTLLLIAVARFPSGFGVPVTSPAFLWSPDNLGVSGVKDYVDYRTISPRELAKTVLSKGGWSNLMCSGGNRKDSMDFALLLIGSKLHSSDISRSEHADQDLVNLLKDSFTASSFSLAFPYVSLSNEMETFVNTLFSEFTENCKHHLGVRNVAVWESCPIKGANFKNLSSFDAFQEYVVSTMQTRQQGEGKTDLIVFCDGESKPVEKFKQMKSEGQVLSELTDILKQFGAKHTVLYASNPYWPLQLSSHLPMKRFLAEDKHGNLSANSTQCDGVCQIKSSILEGVFVGIILLIILLSGLCCMMGIETPTRFEAPQES